MWKSKDSKQTNRFCRTKWDDLPYQIARHFISYSNQHSVVLAQGQKNKPMAQNAAPEQVQVHVETSYMTEHYNWRGRSDALVNTSVGNIGYPNGEWGKIGFYLTRQIKLSFRRIKHPNVKCNIENLQKTCLKICMTSEKDF